MNRTRSFSCECCRVQSPFVFKPGCPGCKARQEHIARVKAMVAASPGEHGRAAP